MRRLNSLSSLIPTTVAALMLLALGAFSTPSYAQVKPGDFITPENASKVQDLVGPGVYYKVQRGMSMKIVPTERVDWPPPYKDATEKYSSQVRLSQDKRSLVGFVAGQPFPLIDANDPDVAVKVIWNNVFRPITSDDYDLRFYDCDSEYEKKGPQTGQIEYFQIGHYAGYDLVGRTEVEPIPTDPDFIKNRPLLAVRPVPTAGAAGNSRNRFHPMAVRRSETWRRHLEPRRGLAPPPPQQRSDHEFVDHGRRYLGPRLGS